MVTAMKMNFTLISLGHVQRGDQLKTKFVHLQERSVAVQGIALHVTVLCMGAMVLYFYCGKDQGRLSN